MISIIMSGRNDNFDDNKDDPVENFYSKRVYLSVKAMSSIPEFEVVFVDWCSEPDKKFKTYLVQVDGDVTGEALEQLRKGVELKDGMTLPAEASKVEQPEWLWERDPPVRFRASVPTSWVEISICEGRNRQVRRMTAAVGFPTLRLIRTKIGAIDLVQMGLQPGETKEIEPLLYPDFQNIPAEEPYRSRSYVKKPGGTGGKPMVRKNKDGSVKKSGTKRIWQMDDSEKPKRKTNGTTRPNTKAPRGRGRNGR